MYLELSWTRKKGPDIGIEQNYEVLRPALTLSSVLPLSEHIQTLPAWQDTSPSVKSSEAHWVKDESSIISPHPASPRRDRKSVV